MRFFLSIISFFLISNLFAQNKKQQRLLGELEAVVAEADKLFAYRMVEWWGSELTEKDKELDQQVGDYIIYHEDKKIYFVLIDHTYKQKLGTYYVNFDSDEATIRLDSTQGKLTRKERKHYRIHQRMTKNVNKIVEDRIIEREGFSASTILIKQKKGYKLYLLANTKEVNIIPLGNDAVFHSNNQGKINKWEWYHEDLIPIPISREGIRLTTHKHEKGQGLISPTEIANFRLYGMLYNMFQMPILIEEDGLLLEYEVYDNIINAFYPKQ